MPIYKVVVEATKEAQIVEETRLIEAKNSAGALAHVAETRITVTKARTADLIALTKAGIEVEKAQ